MLRRPREVASIQRNRNNDRVESKLRIAPRTSHTKKTLIIANKYSRRPLAD